MSSGHEENGAGNGLSGARGTARRRPRAKAPEPPADPLVEAEYLIGGDDRPVLITGGAGFVGANLADRLLSIGCDVLLYDNLSRPGVERNADWLRSRHGDRVRLKVADVRDLRPLRAAVRQAGRIFHFAAQVAVTTSLRDPVHDFDVNARGTLNLLELLRACDPPPPLIYTSTNKVYGGLRDVPLRRARTRYEPADAATRRTGIGERALDFHSPYGCSKGAADQYVLDYARTFGLPAAVLRMSCIYGPRQMGTEDQGWVAHFLMRAMRGETLTVFGDGRQVRDILFVDDLTDAMLLAQAGLSAGGRRVAARPFNIGGGPRHTTSLVELVDLIGELHGRRPDVRFEPWRPGDQRYYVSDAWSFQAVSGWSPRVGVREGVERLDAWLRHAAQRRSASPRAPAAVKAPAS